MHSEVDFYSMGVRYAFDQFANWKKTASEIGEKYGADAQLEFEAGVSSSIPTFSSQLLTPVSTETQTPISMKSIEEATTDFGCPGMMNNSYLNGTGISRQR